MLTCLTLLSFLMVFIFTFFTHLSRAQKKVQKAKNWALENQLFQIRVHQILYSLDLEKPCFFTSSLAEKNPSLCLCFEYNNRLDPDPNFSGRVKGKLTLEENQLCLYLLSKAEDKVRKEPLLAQVSSWEPSFLMYSEQGLTWEKELPKKNFIFPLAMKITLQNHRQKTVSYAFFFCRQSPKITYNKAFS